MRKGSVFIASLCLATCGGNPPAPSTAEAPAPQRAATGTPPPAAAVARPGLRLGEAVTPRHYVLDLKLDPAREGFSGAVDIDVEVAAPTSVIWLNATDLTVTRAEVTAGGGARAAHVVPNPPGDTDHLGLGVEAPVGPGPARIHIEYTGKVDANETRGLFREESGGDWYLFSHFESTDARRAFPCFDEPAFKTPWTVVLHVPKDLVAVANYPIESETQDGDMKTVRFAETKPIPSYLVALCVGPFAIADGGKAKGGAPVRILAPRGRGVEASYAAQITAPILDHLEDYFGTPYPFAKLDQVAVPKTVSFGAMENPGLIPYVEAWILGRPENDSLARQRKYAEVAAHELAHMWFGDLVTLGWWNDVWLNESFASWMAQKIVIRWAPSWQEDVESVVNRSVGLQTDTLTTARAIRQPVTSANDIEDAFDPISYQKGEAVIDMFENWVGEEAFQRGVRRYLADHAYGTGSTDAFLAAIGAAAGRDVATPFATFTDQAGAPLVSARLACAAGKKPILTLAQRRLVLAGSEADARLWQIPVCVRYGAGKTERRSCTVLATKTADLALDGTCPDWVEPNAGAVGYYRSVLEGDLARALVKHLDRLTAPERMGFLDDQAELVRSGVVPASEVLAMLPAFAPAQSQFLADVAADLIGGVRGELLPPRLWPRLGKLVNRLFAARARELGFEPRPGDDYAARRLRRIVVGTVARLGGDAKLMADARRLALRWLDDRKAVDSDLARTVVGLSAEKGDRAFFERLLGELAKTESLHDRDILFAALGSFHDPALLKDALALVLDKKLDVREAERILGPAAFTPETRDQTRSFVRDHYDEISARLPAPQRVSLLILASSVCDEAGLAEYRSFFEERARSLESGPRTYDHAVERIRGCIALRKLQAPNIEAFFAGAS